MDGGYNTITIFCPKCHKVAAIITEKAGKIKVTQDGKSVLSLLKGSLANKISVNCPSRHAVEVKL